MIKTKEQLLQDIDEFVGDAFNNSYLVSMMTYKNIELLTKVIKKIDDETIAELFYIYGEYKINRTQRILILDMVIFAKASLRYIHCCGINIHNPINFQRIIRRKEFRQTKFKPAPAHPANVLNGTRLCLDLIGVEDVAIRLILDVILKKNRLSKISEEAHQRIKQYQERLRDHLMNSYPSS